MSGPTTILLLIALGLGVAAHAQDATPADAYRLGPEDVLQVQIWNRPDLTGSASLDVAGKIQLPLLGEIKAEGRTVEELGRLLAERYQLLDPSIPGVMVSVSQYNSQSVTVVGEVRNPGRYGFRTIPDLWAVLLAAGGATPSADLTAVQIVRRESEVSEPQAIDVDLSKGIEGTARENLPALRSKDSIIVPPISVGVGRGDRFQVLGAVQTPGIYRLSAASRLTEAISASGGALPNADLHRVRLTRLAEQGGISYQLDLQGYLYSARPMADLELRPGDTITVPAKSSAASLFLDRLVRLAPFASVAVSLALLLD